jgi:hypothetical protein
MSSKRIASSPAEKSDHEKRTLAETAEKMSQLNQLKQQKPPKASVSEAEGSVVRFDVISINENNKFYGSLTEAEILFVWEKVLGRSKDEIFGMTYNRSLTRNFRVTFKLNANLPPSSVYPEPSFVYFRPKPGSTDEEEVDALLCKFVNYDAVKPAELGQLTRITVKTNGFSVPAPQILQWLGKYGSVSANHEYEKNSVGLRTDVLETEIVLREHVPEFLPISGRKLLVSYPGIPKTCNHCYQTGHLKRDCKNKRLSWVDRVREMRASGKFTDDMFGGWVAIIEREN